MANKLDTIVDRMFKVIPVSAESGLYKITKVGPTYWLVCTSSKLKCSVDHHDDTGFIYSIIIGNSVHGGRIAFDNLFFIEFDPETNFKTIKPQEYAATKKQSVAA